MRTTSTHNVIIAGAPSPMVRPATRRAFTLLRTVDREITRLSRGLHVPGSPVHFNIVGGLNFKLDNGALNVMNVNGVNGTMTHHTVTYKVGVVCRGHHRVPASIRRRCGTHFYAVRRLLSATSMISLRVPCAPRARRLVSRGTLTAVGRNSVLVGASHNTYIRRTTLVRTLRSKRLFNTTLSICRFRPRVSPRLFRLSGIIVSPRVNANAVSKHVRVSHYISHGVLRFLGGRPRGVGHMGWSARRAGGHSRCAGYDKDNFTLGWLAVDCLSCSC